jgi:recA bacterial DNA recombination protein
MYAVVAHWVCRRGWISEFHVGATTADGVPLGCAPRPPGTPMRAAKPFSVVAMLQVVKNKCAAPYKISEFDIMFGSGISGLGCMLDAAEAVDVVQKKGSWYSYGDQRLAQGRDKTLALLAEDAKLAG